MGFWGSSKEDRRERFRESASYRPENLNGWQHWATDAEIEEAGGFKPVGTLLGYSLESDRAIYSGLKSPHRISFGPTSAAKTSGAVIPAILSDSLRRASLNIPDIAAEAACVTGFFRSKISRAIILNPLEMYPRQLAGLERGFYNPVPYWTDPASPYFGARAYKLAALAISKGSERDPYWSMKTREAYQFVTMAVRKYDRPQNWNLPYIGKIAHDDLRHYAQFILRRASGDEAIRSLAIPWANPDSSDIRSLNEVIENLRVEVGFLLDERVRMLLSKSNFTFEAGKWCPQTVYTLLPHEVLDGPLVKLLRLTSGMALAETMGQQLRGSLWNHVILDEAFLMDFENLDKLIAGARKFRVAVWPIFQDLAELKAMLPKTHSTAIGNCGTVQIMGVKDLEGSETFSRMIGETEVYSYTKSLNYDQARFNIQPFAGNLANVRIDNVPTDAQLAKLHVTQNYQQQKRRLMLAQELRWNLPADRQILLLNSVAAPILAKVRRYFETDLRRRARPNPYYVEDKRNAQKKRRA